MSKAVLSSRVASENLTIEKINRVSGLIDLIDTYDLVTQVFKRLHLFAFQLGNLNLVFVEQPHVKGFAILIDCTVVAAILIFVLVEHSKTEHVVLAPRK